LVKEGSGSGSSKTFGSYGSGSATLVTTQSFPNNLTTVFSTSVSNLHFIYTI
jgi:hypothetical protein